VRVRLASCAAAVALATGALAGCAAASPEISTATSGAMQTTVVSIAQSAATGDPTTALAQLDALQQQLDAAVADGSVTAERASSIQTRIDLVRGDLQPVVEQAPVVEPAPEAPADTGGTEIDDSGEDDRVQRLRRGVLLGTLDSEPSIAEPFELDLQLVSLQFMGRRCGRVQ